MGKPYNANDPTSDGWTPVRAGVSTLLTFAPDVSYTAVSPAAHGLIEWNYDPIATSSGSGQVATSQTLYLMKLIPVMGGTVNNIVVSVGTAGATLTSGQNLAGVYDSTGALIATTADQSTAWGTTGVKTMALTTSVKLKTGQTYFVALLSNGTTPASFVRGSATGVATPNALLSAASYRFCTNGTGLTALPASLTLSSNSASGAQTYWVALS